MNATLDILCFKRTAEECKDLAQIAIDAMNTPLLAALPYQDRNPVDRFAAMMKEIVSNENNVYRYTIKDQERIIGFGAAYSTCWSEQGPALVIAFVHPDYQKHPDLSRVLDDIRHEAGCESA